MILKLVNNEPIVEISEAYSNAFEKVLLLIQVAGVRKDVDCRLPSQVEREAAPDEKGRQNARDASG
jgi:hypothetical protein